MILYHVTTAKRVRQYHRTGFIISPVRGFTTLMGAMAWAIKTGRKIIMQVEGEPAYKLPDHHNDYGEAWWINQDVPRDKTECIFSADSSFDPVERI